MMGGFDITVLQSSRRHAAATKPRIEEEKERSFNLGQPARDFELSGESYGLSLRW